MSSTMVLGGRRWCTVSIQSPGRSASEARFSGRTSHSVSKRPIWLAEAARPIGAAPPTTQRIAGSNPVVTETPEEVLQIRLQHPAYHATGDDLVEGRQGMMGAELRPAAE